MHDLLKRDVAIPVFALIAFQALTTMSLNGFANAPVEVARDYGIPESYTGVFSALVYFSALTFGLFTAGPFGRFGAMRSCQAVLLLGAVGMAVFTLATPWAFILSAVLIGLAHGPMNPAGSHVIMRKGPKEWRPFLFSVKQTSVPVGGALAGFLIPTLVLGIGWQSTMLAIAAAIALAALAAEPYRDDTDHDRDPAFPMQIADLKTPFRLVFAKGPLRSICIAGYVLVGCQACLTAFLVVFLIKELDFSHREAGFVFGLAHGTSIAARIWLGAIADRIVATKTILGVSGIVTGLCFVALALFPSGGPLWLLCVLGVVLGNANLGWIGLYLSETAKLAPAGQAAEATAGAQLYMFGSFVTVAPALTLLAEALGNYATGFAVMGVLGTLAGVRFLAIKY